MVPDCASRFHLHVAFGSRHVLILVDFVCLWAYIRSFPLAKAGSHEGQSLG